MISSVAWPMIVVASFIERPEWVSRRGLDRSCVRDVDDAVERHTEPG